jgi:hypothetical protein
MISRIAFKRGRKSDVALTEKDGEFLVVRGTEVKGQLVITESVTTSHFPTARTAFQRLLATA